MAQVLGQTRPLLSQGANLERDRDDAKIPYISAHDKVKATVNSSSADVRN